MAEGRRLPGLGVVVAGLLLLGTLVGVWWWQFRPKSETPTDPSALAQLDVVCLGRVDGLNPVIALEPSVPGKVLKVHAPEGTPVKANAPLLELDAEAAKLRVTEAQAAVDGAAAEVQAAEQEAAAFEDRKRLAAAAVKAATARREAAEAVRKEKELQLHKNLANVTPTDVAVARAEAEQLGYLEVAEQTRLRELQRTNPYLKLEAALARKKAAEVALQQARNAVRDCVLTAPSDGTVLRVLVSVGETVAPGTPQPAVVFRPDGPLVVRAELDQEFLGRVAKGMRATVRDNARADSPTWTGTVERVGNWVARKRSVVLEPGEVNDVRTIECVIRLDGPTDGLLIGQRVRVRIGGGER
jgi:multidrug resistance efflux pump